MDQTNQPDRLRRLMNDLRRTIDYLQTRNDLNTGAIGYYGLSWGARIANVLAVEDRIKAAVLYGGRLAKRAHETRNGTLKFPGRSIRCSRPGPHHGVAWYTVHPAAPAAELPRSPCPHDIWEGR